MPLTIRYKIWILVTYKNEERRAEFVGENIYRMGRLSIRGGSRVKHKGGGGRGIFLDFTHILGDPDVTANIYCTSRNLPDTDTQYYSTDLR